MTSCHQLYAVRLSSVLEVVLLLEEEEEQTGQFVSRQSTVSRTDYKEGGWKMSCPWALAQ